ncbi:MAG: hypothetical protein M0D57_11750 [Sphingobacteriales bacterium JAD_PAG50586_3]|nr:MAG: hypothetical protein M0D57_11750 [Sphingobacteriales bacterium JAD_PAG50586_3]
MATDTKKYPPKVTFKYFLELINNTFSALSKLSGDYPDIMMGGIPFNRVYLINHPHIIQQILQKIIKTTLSQTGTMCWHCCWAMAWLPTGAIVGISSVP